MFRSLSISFARSLGSLLLASSGLFGASAIAQDRQPVPAQTAAAAPSATSAGGSLSPQQLPRTDQLPADATAYLYRMGRERLRDRLNGTCAAQAIADPAVQSFFEELQRLGARKDARSALVSFVVNALQEDTVMSCIASAASDKPAAIPGDPQEVIPPHATPISGHFAVIEPTADGLTVLRKGFEPAIEAWPANSTRTEIAGSEFEVLGNESDGVYAGWVNDFQSRSGPVLLWCLGNDTVKAALTPHGEKTLARSEFFQTAVNPLLKGRTDQPIAIYYYDLRPSWETAPSSPASALWNQMSWRSIDSVSGATFVEGRGFRNRHYWRLNDQRIGLFQHSQTERIKDDWLRKVPADATGFTTGLLDGNSFILTLMTAGMKLFGAGDDVLVGAGAGALMLNSASRLIGPHYLVYRVPNRYGNFPLEGAMPTANLVIALEIKDREAFDQALSAILNMAPGMSRTVELGGQKVITLNLMYFTLHLALLDDVLLATSHASLLKDALDNWKKPAQSIVDSDHYKAAQKHRLPDACFMMYFPPGGFSRGIYDHYIPQLQQMLAMFEGFQGMFGGGQNRGSAAGEGFRSIHLPRGRDMSQYVAEATILTARDDGHGVLFDGYAPLLSTPYYWTYCHALLRLQPGGLENLFPMFGYLVSPLEGDAADPVPPRANE